MYLQPQSRQIKQESGKIFIQQLESFEIQHNEFKMELLC